VRATTAGALATILAATAMSAGCSGFGSKSTDELRIHADEAFQREEYKRAIAFDSEILRREPGDYRATLQRGVAYDRLGAVPDAAQDYGRAIELDPEAGAPRLYRANLALRTGQIQAAEEDVAALASLKLPRTQQVAALVIQGTLAQEKGDVATALGAYNRAIEIGRGDPDPATGDHYRDALNNASECYYRMGLFDRAASLYEELMDAKVRAGEPATEDDRYTMGVLCYLRGDFARARQEFAQVSPERRKKAAQLLNDESFFASAK
jgi:tetratricopeptide (TPR) repeat protein